MIKKTLLFITLFVSITSFSQSQLSDSQFNEINTFIKKTMKQIEIPGVAVAIIKDHKVVYKNYLGKANLEYKIPVNESSVFRLHSLSKIFVSVGIFKLIEQNKISLTDKISKHLEGLPNEWKNIKIKNLLSHSSGLPDMREETNPSEEIAMKNVYGKEIQFPVGERASYNQTNFWILNRIIRKVTNSSFQNHIKNQFGKKSEVCFSNIADIVSNRVMEYKPNNIGQLKNAHFIVQDYMFGAGGITMTLDHLINWDKKLNDNLLISESSKKEMLTKFKYRIGKGFSYGWDIQNLNGITSYGFNGGGLVNYRKFPSKNITVIWFTNGYRKPHNIDKITNTLVGLIDKDLVDRTPEFYNSLKQIISNFKPKQVIKEYYKLKNKYTFVNYQQVINGLGYQFLAKKNIDSAITLFQLNTKEFPKSSNAFDSLGEAYYSNKQYQLSKNHYQKSLELNPSSSNAKMMIDKIKKLK
jgi:CubicO group peptidase (beta-lactamase class C family)